MSENSPNLFHALGVPHEYNHVAGAIVVAGALTVIGLKVRASLSNLDDEKILPAPRVTLVNISSSIVELWRGLLDSIVGHGADKYVPIVGTTFLFILMSNLMGLIPGFLPPTENINTNAAMAIVIFILYQALGFKENGIGYLKQFTGGLPPAGYGLGLTIFLSLIACLLVVIEVVGHAIRPLSLSLRLWGNIFGDHTLVGAFFGIFPLFLPILFMALGVFVSLVQAFVFSLLSTVYIKLAVSHDH